MMGSVARSFFLMTVVVAVLSTAFTLGLGRAKFGQFWHPLKTKFAGHHIVQAERLLAGKDPHIDDRRKRDLNFNYEKKHFYSYWGMGTSLTILPVVALAGKQVTPRRVVFGLTTIVVLVWMFLITQLQAFFRKDLSAWEWFALSFFPVLGTIYYFHAYFPLGSYIRQLFSFAYLSGALAYFFWRMNRGFRIVDWLPLGFLLAMMCACRLFCFQFIPFLVGAFALYATRTYGYRHMMGLPLCGLLLIGAFFHENYWYVEKFGQGLMSNVHAEGKPFSLEYVKHNFETYFLNPIDFMWFRGAIKWDFNGNALWSYQFAIWIVPLGLLAGKWRNKIGRDTIWLVVLLGGVWLVEMTLLLMFRYTGHITFGGRYLLDVVPLMVVVLYVFYFRLDKPYLKGLALTLMLLSVFVQQYAAKPWE